MAFEGDLDVLVGISAAADLSAKQFCAVKMSGDLAVAACSVAGERSVGILQNDPASGQSASVCHSGQCKAKLGATVASAGLPLQCDANGALIPAVSGKFVIALSMQAGASGDIADVLVQPGNELLA